MFLSLYNFSKKYSFKWRILSQPGRIIEKKFFFDKTQNHDLFISPKRKKPILEMALKSLDISILDYQMSKS